MIRSRSGWNGGGSGWLEGDGAGGVAGLGRPGCWCCWCCWFSGIALASCDQGADDDECRRAGKTSYRAFQVSPLPPDQARRFTDHCYLGIEQGQARAVLAFCEVFVAKRACGQHRIALRDECRGGQYRRAGGQRQTGLAQEAPGDQFRRGCAQSHEHPGESQDHARLGVQALGVRAHGFTFGGHLAGDDPKRRRTFWDGHGTDDRSAVTAAPAVTDQPGARPFRDYNKETWLFGL